MIFRSSLLDLRSPFIFQLPATKGRRSTLAISLPRKRVEAVPDRPGARKRQRHRGRPCDGTLRRVAALERDGLFFESPSRSNLLLEHDLFRKPESTFRDHALVATAAGDPYKCASA